MLGDKRVHALSDDVSVDLKQDENVLSPRRSIIMAYRSILPHGTGMH